MGEVWKISKEINFPKLFEYIDPALYCDISHFGTIVQAGGTPLMVTSDPSGYGFREFCLKQGMDFITLKQSIFFRQMS